MNKENQITRILNNYARMSFNFGPTLLSWLAENAARTYRMILDGERRSRELFDGHSSAMAQVYNHLIMPLANRRDRLTQIRWGIADYNIRFGHAPEGMWLAETAADTETLRLLAAGGHQASPSSRRANANASAPQRRHSRRQLRSKLGKPTGDWINTRNATVDPTHPYLVRFASGLSLAVFFYDGPTSRAIAFEGLLNSGEDLRHPPQAGLSRQQPAASWSTSPPTARATATTTAWRNGTRLRPSPAWSRTRTPG